MKVIRLVVKLAILLTTLGVSWVSCAPIDVSTPEGQLEYFRMFSSSSSFSPDIRDGRSARDDHTSGLVTFQRRFRLKPTGYVDGPTLNLLVKSRCGNQDDHIDLEVPVTPVGRKKRSTVARQRWLSQVLKYRLKNGPNEIGFDETRNVLRQAFQIWESAGTPLRFVEGGPGDNVHIVVDFLRGEHGDFQNFDGKGRPGSPNILSHSFQPPSDETVAIYPEDGDIHLDDDDPFSTNPTIHEFDLLSVLVHEIGHALGLGHTGDINAAMSPFINRGKNFTGLRLADVEQIKGIYGDGTTTTAVPTTITSAGDRFLNCGSTQFLSPSETTYIRSPNFGSSDYPNDINCTWVFTTAPGYILRVDSTDFETEYGYDIVKVFDGTTVASTTIADFSGKLLNVNAVSTRPAMTISFVADYSAGAPGFVCTVQSVALGLPFTLSTVRTSTTTASTTSTTTTPRTTTSSATTTTSSGSCGGIVTLNPGQTKVISSPGYPARYPLNMQCEWKINAQPNQRIRVLSTYFYTESYYDPVELFDGTSTNSNRINKYSGNSVISETSSGPNAFIKFTSDDQVSADGFTLEVTAIGAAPTTSSSTSTTTATTTSTITTVTPTTTTSTQAPGGCGGTFYLAPAASMTITSPNYPQNYPNYADCKWIFNTASNARIRLTSTTYNTEYGYDSTEVFDGPNDASPRLTRYDGVVLKVEQTTSQPSMMIHFTSDHTQTATGFSMLVSAFVSGQQVTSQGTTSTASMASTVSTTTAQTVTTDGSCGGSHTLYSGALEIKSPGHPNFYPLNKKCTWVVYTTSSMKIQVQSIEFQTEESYDFLVIHDGSAESATEIGRYHGVSSFFTTSTGSSMTLVFTSDDVVASAGFVLKLIPLPKADQCNVVTCGNGGTCQPVPGGNPAYKCQCTTGFTGPLCTEHICTINPCANGGSCTAISVGRKYQCNCPVGFQQPNCTVHVCQSQQPCLNGGTCLRDSNGEGYSCKCTSYYLGGTCSAHVCNGSPCLNGGSCVPQSQGYDCNCNFGFSGPNCTRHICSQNPCENGGTCQQTYAQEGYLCNCALGYSGTNCTTRAGSSCSQSPCQNGGTCTPLSRDPGYSCGCPPGYSGTNCQDSSCTSNPCKNGGTCQTMSFSPYFRCTCPPNYVGPQCQGAVTTTEAPTIDISVLNEFVGADDIDLAHDSDGNLALYVFKGSQVFKYSRGIQATYDRAYPQDIVEYGNFWPVFGPVRAVVFIPKQEQVGLCTTGICPRDASSFLPNVTLRKDNTAIFMSQHFARFDQDGQFENSYGNISTSIIGLPNDLDCAFHVKDTTYYVKGDRYYEVKDYNNKTVTQDSPKYVSNSPFKAVGQSIDSGFYMDKKLHLISGNRYFKYSENLLLEAGPVTLRTPAVTPAPPTDNSIVDALCVGNDGYLKVFKDEMLHIFQSGSVEVKATSKQYEFVNEKIDAALEEGNKVLLFKGNHVVKYSNGVTFPPYPKLSEEFPGITSNYKKVDSAFKVNGVTYFTSGTTFIEYRGPNNVDIKPISQSPFSAMSTGIDAGFFYEGKLHLVKGSKYYRYSESLQLDPGYPRDTALDRGVIGRTASISDTVITMLNYMQGAKSSQGNNGNTPSPGTTLPVTTPPTQKPTTTYPIIATTRPAAARLPDVVLSENICDGRTVDAAYSKDDYIYAFVGTYLYRLESNPGANNYKVSPGYPERISNIYPEIIGPVDGALLWPAMTDKPETLFIFVGEFAFRKEGNNTIERKTIRELFAGIPGPIDAAFIWQNDGFTYLIKGSRYFICRTHVYFTLPIALPMATWNLPDGATAAFNHKNQNHFFVGDDYFLMNNGPSRQMSGDSPRSVRRYWFNCPADNDI